MHTDGNQIPRPATWLVVACLVAAAGAATGPTPPSATASPDEFDLSRHSVPLEHIMMGGPTKDGIPALTAPGFVTAAEATFLAPADRVVGIERGGGARAYPLAILNWHEIVNDVVHETPIAVTYCPLTGSAVVFDRRHDGDVLSFGVSGRLYESNVLMYDHQSESLWSQLGASAVTGARTGARLVPLPATVTTWRAWRRLHPDTMVLSRATGHERDYGRNPYEMYEESGSLIFRPSRRDPRLPAKARVLGVIAGGAARAYPRAEIAGAGGRIVDRIGDREITVVVDDDGLRVIGDGDTPVIATDVYWFAWAAFHPETSVWRPRPATRPDGPAHARLGDVSIVEVNSYWTSLGAGLAAAPGANPFAAGNGLFVISGTIRNESSEAVEYVLLRFELLDGSGAVVYREEGFNRSAEGMVPNDDDPAPQVARASVRPIAAGASDSYRMIFLGNEIPRFQTPRVSVVAVE